MDIFDILGLPTNPKKVLYEDNNYFLEDNSQSTKLYRKRGFPNQIGLISSGIIGYSAIISTVYDEENACNCKTIYLGDSRESAIKALWSARHQAY